MPAAGRIECRHPSRGLRLGVPALLCVSDKDVRLRRHADARALRAGATAPAAPVHRWRRRRQRLVGHAMGGDAWGGAVAFQVSADVDIPRGHRRASMARRCQTPSKKTTARYLYPRQAGACDRVGGGLGRWLTARVEGISVCGSSAGRGPSTSRGRIFIERPRISAVQAEIRRAG